MKIDQNPFSIYDFLGYLIPGSLFIIGVLFFSKVDFCSAPVLYFSDVKIEQYVVLLFICYVSGHVLSYISSISIECFSIWSLGYPSAYLLGKPIRGFWSNLVTKGCSKISVFFKVIMCIAIFPVVITDLIVRKLMRNRTLLGKPIDRFSSMIIQKKMNDFIDHHYDYEEAKKIQNESIHNIDYFRLVYHYTCEHSKMHFNKMQNYVALYGFSRTICFTSIVLLWMIVFQLIVWGHQGFMYIYIIGLFSLSAVMYLDFNKFYRKYSLEALMAFATIFEKTAPEIVSTANLNRDSSQATEEGR